MQLLHWICVYCGCVSIRNCESSQSEIYLTAKTVGEAREDTGALSFKTRRMDPASSLALPLLFSFFFFLFLFRFGTVRAGQPVDGRRGQFGSVPTRRRWLSCGDARRGCGGLALKRHLHPLRRVVGGGGETLERCPLLKGYWLSTYCSISCSA